MTKRVQGGRASVPPRHLTSILGNRAATPAIVITVPSLCPTRGDEAGAEFAQGDQSNQQQGKEQQVLGLVDSADRGEGVKSCRR
jgi:hypothetical protein